MNYYQDIKEALIKNETYKRVKDYSKNKNDLETYYKVRNLYNMRLLYIKFKNLQTVSAKLSWSHYCEILPIEEESKRNYYINISIKENLSIRELRNRIMNM